MIATPQSQNSINLCHEAVKWSDSVARNILNDPTNTTQTWIASWTIIETQLKENLEEVKLCFKVRARKYTQKSPSIAYVKSKWNIS